MKIIEALFATALLGMALYGGVVHLDMQTKRNQADEFRADVMLFQEAVIAHQREFPFDSIAHWDIDGADKNKHFLKVARFLPARFSETSYRDGAALVKVAKHGSSLASFGLSPYAAPYRTALIKDDGTGLINNIPNDSDRTYSLWLWTDVVGVRNALTLEHALVGLDVHVEPKIDNATHDDATPYKVHVRIQPSVKQLIAEYGAHTQGSIIRRDKDQTAHLSGMLTPVRYEGDPNTGTITYTKSIKRNEECEPGGKLVVHPNTGQVLHCKKGHTKWYWESLVPQNSFDFLSTTASVPSRVYGDRTLKIAPFERRHGTAKIFPVPVQSNNMTGNRWPLSTKVSTCQKNTTDGVDIFFTTNDCEKDFGIIRGRGAMVIRKEDPDALTLEETKDYQTVLRRLGSSNLTISPETKATIRKSETPFRATCISGAEIVKTGSSTEFVKYYTKGSDFTVVEKASERPQYKVVHNAQVGHITPLIGMCAAEDARVSRKEIGCNRADIVVVDRSVHTGDPTTHPSRLDVQSCITPPTKCPPNYELRGKDCVLSYVRTLELVKPTGPHACDFPSVRCETFARGSHHKYDVALVKQQRYKHVGTGFDKLEYPGFSCAHKGSADVTLEDGAIDWCEDQFTIPAHYKFKERIASAKVDTITVDFDLAHENLPKRLTAFTGQSASDLTDDPIVIKSVRTRSAGASQKDGSRAPLNPKVARSSETGTWKSAAVCPVGYWPDGSVAHNTQAEVDRNNILQSTAGRFWRKSPLQICRSPYGGVLVALDDTNTPWSSAPQCKDAPAAVFTGEQVGQKCKINYRPWKRPYEKIPLTCDAGQLQDKFGCWAVRSTAAEGTPPGDVPDPRPPRVDPDCADDPSAPGCGACAAKPAQFKPTEVAVDLVLGEDKTINLYDYIETFCDASETDIEFSLGTETDPENHLAPPTLLGHQVTFRANDRIIEPPTGTITVVVNARDTSVDPAASLSPPLTVTINIMLGTPCPAVQEAAIQMSDTGEPAHWTLKLPRAAREDLTVRISVDEAQRALVTFPAEVKFPTGVTEQTITFTPTATAQKDDEIDITFSVVAPFRCSDLETTLKIGCPQRILVTPEDDIKITPGATATMDVGLSCPVASETTLSIIDAEEGGKDDFNAPNPNTLTFAPNGDTKPPAQTTTIRSTGAGNVMLTFKDEAADSKIPDVVKTITADELCITIDGTGCGTPLTTLRSTATESSKQSVTISTDIPPTSKLAVSLTSSDERRMTTTSPVMLGPSDLSKTIELVFKEEPDTTTDKVTLTASGTTATTLHDFEVTDCPAKWTTGFGEAQVQAGTTSRIVLEYEDCSTDPAPTIQVMAKKTTPSDIGCRSFKEPVWTFASGEHKGELAIPATGDATNGDACEIEMTIGDGIHAVEKKTLKVTVGTMTPVVQFETISPEENPVEEGREEKICLTANPIPTSDLAVRIQRAGSTATYDKDYRFSPAFGPVATIPSGRNSFCTTLSVIRDDDEEEDESVMLTIIETGTGYTVGPYDTYTLTIAGDVEPSIVVRDWVEEGYCSFLRNRLSKPGVQSFYEFICRNKRPYERNPAERRQSLSVDGVASTWEWSRKSPHDHFSHGTFLSADRYFTNLRCLGDRGGVGKKHPSGHIIPSDFIGAVYSKGGRSGGRSTCVAAVLPVDCPNTTDNHVDGYTKSTLPEFRLGRRVGDEPTVVWVTVRDSRRYCCKAGWKPDKEPDSTGWFKNNEVPTHCERVSTATASAENIGRMHLYEHDAIAQKSSSFFVRSAIAHDPRTRDKYGRLNPPNQREHKAVVDTYWHANDVWLPAPKEDVHIIQDMYGTKPDGPDAVYRYDRREDDGLGGMSSNTWKDTDTLGCVEGVLDVERGYCIIEGDYGKTDTFRAHPVGAKPFRVQWGDGTKAGPTSP